MTDAPWGAGDDSPMNEGSETTAVSGGSVGEQRAGEVTADGYTGDGPGGSGDKLPWGADEEAHPGAAEQGGQPNLTPEPAVSGRPSRLSPGATDDAPGTPQSGAGGSGRTGA